MENICAVKIFFFSMMITILICCKKETSCEGCASNKENKPPIAIAGPDQLITLPTDSVLLDGRISSDPDGIISSFFWTKISGPSSFIIIKPSDSVTKVKTLVKGAYLFELKVTDNGGLFAKDTVQVTVNDQVQTNHPPFANAGPDQTITLPNNSVSLDGSGSTDPDNNITAYSWTKISGPPSPIITNTNAIQTQAAGLIEGIYKFELKVTDAGGLFSKDTVQINIQSTPPPISNCNIGNRPMIQTQLTEIGTLSQTRAGISIASVGNKILFAGGEIGFNQPTSRVDIFDIATNTWSTTELCEARSGISSAVSGNKIFFGGGGNYLGTIFSKKVDIYDFVSNTWSISELSLARTAIAAAAINNKIIFAGGAYQHSPFEDIFFTDKVDIYDILNNSWTTATLSQPKGEFTATVAGSKVYFAGGTVQLNIVNDFTSTSVVDVYDANLNSWSVTSSLSETKALHTAAINNGKIFWAGGRSDPNLYPYVNNVSPVVEIRDMNTQSSSLECLFQPNFSFNSVVKDNKVIFFTGEGVEQNKFDIYDMTTNSWSIGLLDRSITGASIISVTNNIYIAGGYINGVLSNKVWKLEF